jgi:biopolymer transport protein ExbB
MSVMNGDNAFGLISFLSRADGMGLAVLAVLFAMSLASWYLIVVKAMRNMQIKRRANAFLEQFWDARSMETVGEKLVAHPPDEPFGRLAAAGINAALHHRRPAGASLTEAGGPDEFVTRAIRRAIAREAAGLEWGLTVLASVGSTAPFVGLLGTVWSIYLALTSIVAGSGKATLDAVAGPVGEALIMTACGLAVAIPAVLAYNAFVRANRLTLSELDGFAHDLHTFLVTGARSNERTARRQSPPLAAVQGEARPGAA